MVAPSGTTDRSKAIKARRANLALVFPVNMLVPIPLLLSPALVSYSVLSLLEPIIIDWAELEGTAVGGIAVGCTEVGGAGVGSVGCPSVRVIVAVMKGYMEQKKANSRASRNVNSEVCRLFSVPLSQMSVLSAGTSEVVVCGAAPWFSQIMVVPTATERFSSVKSSIGEFTKFAVAGVSVDVGGTGVGGHGRWWQTRRRHGSRRGRNWCSSCHSWQCRSVACGCYGRGHEWMYCAPIRELSRLIKSETEGVRPCSWLGCPKCHPCQAKRRTLRCGARRLRFPK